MLWNLLKQAELSKLNLDVHAQILALRNGITESQRSALSLRDTDIAKPQRLLYERGIR